MYKPIKLVGSTIGRSEKWSDPKEQEVSHISTLLATLRDPKKFELDGNHANSSGKDSPISKESLEMAVSSQVVFCSEKDDLADEKPLEKPLVKGIVVKGPDPIFRKLPELPAEASMQSPMNISLDFKPKDVVESSDRSSSKVVKHRDLPADIKLLLSTSNASSILSNPEIPELHLSSTVFDMISSLEHEQLVIMRKDPTAAGSDELFTRMDLLSTLFDAESMQEPLSSYIEGIRPIKSVHPDETLDKVLALMLSTSSNVLAVSEDGVISGIVSCSDILALVRQNELQVRRAQRQLHKAHLHMSNEYSLHHSPLEQPTHANRMSIASLQNGNLGQGRLSSPPPLPPRARPDSEMRESGAVTASRGRGKRPTRS